MCARTSAHNTETKMWCWNQRYQISIPIPKSTPPTHTRLFVCESVVLCSSLTFDRVFFSPSSSEEREKSCWNTCTPTHDSLSVCESVRDHHSIITYSLSHFCDDESVTVTTKEKKRNMGRVANILSFYRSNQPTEKPGVE